jgi:hypothetical protein
LKSAAIMLAFLLLIIMACDSTTSPGSQPNPAGTVIAWFNGNSDTIDLYFPGCDSLVNNAYITGNTPNDLLDLGSDMLAVVNSLSSNLQIFDLSASGAVTYEIVFPPGSNPWAMTYGYDNIWVTLLMSHQVATVSTEDWTLGGAIEVSDNPSGIAIASGSIFVSHGNFPVTSSPGGVTVLDAVTLDQTGWIDTGVNTTELWYCEETGMIHAFSTTYVDDGVVSIIDPVNATLFAQVQTGGDPHSPVRLGSSFACCDGFGSTIFFYSESGTLQSTWDPDASAALMGLAVSGDTLYMTDFTGDKVNRALWLQQDLLDPVTAGDGPQGIISIDRE